MAEMTSYENGTPCWVDMGTPDVEASAAFYSALLGWEVEIGPAEMGHYSMAVVRGHNVAAIADQQTPGHVSWTTYIAVDDLDATMAKATAAGATTLVDAMDVMTFGRMAMVLDPAGTPVSFWQAGDHIGASLVNEPGSICWNELTTRDVDTSLAFYEAAVGITSSKMPYGDGDYYELQLPGGRTIGGLMPMVGETWDGVPNHWMVYFAVTDTDATAARCTELGGAVTVPPTDIPPGRFAVLTDPHGAVFSVLQFANPT